MKALVITAMLFAAAPAPQPVLPPTFVPTVLFYMDDVFVKLVQVDSPKATTQECLKELNDAIGKEVAEGHVPEGGRIIGACVPVPTFKAAPEKDHAWHDSTPESLGGHRSITI